MFMPICITQDAPVPQSLGIVQTFVQKYAIDAGSTAKVHSVPIVQSLWTMQNPPTPMLLGMSPGWPQIEFTAPSPPELLELLLLLELPELLPLLLELLLPLELLLLPLELPPLLELPEPPPPLPLLQAKAAAEARDRTMAAMSRLRMGLGGDMTYSVGGCKRHFLTQRRPCRAEQPKKANRDAGVGRLGIEPRTYGLKVRSSAD